jgi:hypothetical protein
LGFISQSHLANHANEKHPFPGRIKPSGPAFGRPKDKLRGMRSGVQRNMFAEGGPSIPREHHIIAMDDFGAARQAEQSLDVA